MHCDNKQCKRALKTPQWVVASESCSEIIWNFLFKDKAYEGWMNWSLTKALQWAKLYVGAATIAIKPWFLSSFVPGNIKKRINIKDNRAHRGTTYLLNSVEVGLHAFDGYFLPSFNGLCLEYFRKCPFTQVPKHSIFCTEKVVTVGSFLYFVARITKKCSKASFLTLAKQMWVFNPICWSITYCA